MVESLSIKRMAKNFLEVIKHSSPVLRFKKSYKSEEVSKLAKANKLF